MRCRLWIAGFSWSLLLVAPLAGCSGADDDDDTTSQGDDDTGPASIQPYLELDGQVDQSTTEPGHYTIHYTLYGDEGSSFEVNGSYSLDGVTFMSITSGGGEVTTGLSASPDGVAHTLTWATLEDLGFVDTDVWFRLSGKGDGYDLEAHTIKVAINNVGYDAPCYIMLASPTVQDGDIPLTYTLTDTGGDVCSVSIQITLPGDSGSVSATASANATSDPLTGIVVPAGQAVTQTFVWDSLTDIGAVDEDVSVVITAHDVNHDEQDILPIQVQNSPVPEEGEIIFTEIFFFPLYSSGQYLELYNTSRHTLNLQNTRLSSVATTYLLVSPDQPLEVLPGQYVVLAQADPGTYPIDWVYGSSGYTINKFIDTLTLAVGDTVIDTVSYDSDNYGENDVFGHSIGLLPEFMDAAANDSADAWCLEMTPLPLEAGAQEGQNDFGSPGVATTCDAPEATPAPVE